MATKVYETDNIVLIDGTELTLVPLKIWYLREFMDKFQIVKTANDDFEAISYLVDCALVAMKQYYPLIKTAEELEDVANLPTIYKILDVAAGIKVDENKNEDVKDQAVKSGSSWDDLDLVKLESEVFLLGIWKDYAELEMSLSMPELLATLSSKRELDYQEKKFLAAIQGVDLEADNSKQNAWEEKKAKFFSRGRTSDGNDIIALQGANAAKAGFGIGMGLGYEDLTKKK